MGTTIEHPVHLAKADMDCASNQYSKKERQHLDALTRRQIGRSKPIKK